MTAAGSTDAPAGVLRVLERPAAVGFPLYMHDGWSEEENWLVHGITARGADMSLFGGASAGVVLGRWADLRDALACTALVHARQVHGGAMLVHEAVPEGVLIARDADGHATETAGALLAVSVADCVPVYLAARDERAIALLHAGWRGVVAGIVENGIAALARAFGASAHRLRVHCGPAICGACYEVGPEVPQQLGLEGTPRYLDLRAVIARRLVAAGVPARSVTLSAFCTRCGGSPFYSHRGGCAERQLAVLAVRARP